MLAMRRMAPDAGQTTPARTIDGTSGTSKSMVSMHIHEQSGLGLILGSCATPLSYAYTRATWTWVHSGLRTAPQILKSNQAKQKQTVSYCSSATSEVDLGQFWAQNAPLCDPSENR